MIVTGAVGAGKTTAVTRLAEDLAARGIRLGGIVAPRVVHDGVTVGYDVTDLITGTRAPLASQSPPGARVGRFHLADAGLRFAHQAIVRALAEADAVCIDEIGPAELAGRGHAAGVTMLLTSGKPAVLVVRERLVPAAKDRFGLTDAVTVAVP